MTRRSWFPPFLVPTLERACASVGGLPEGVSVHLDRGYDSNATCERLKERGLLAEISKKGKPAPLQATKRWVSGENVRLDLSQPEDSQRLREVMRHRGCVRLRSDESADGEAVGACLGLIGQSLQHHLCRTPCSTLLAAHVLNAPNKTIERNANR
jgi:hypothetical protein